MNFSVFVRSRRHIISTSFNFLALKFKNLTVLGVLRLTPAGFWYRMTCCQLPQAGLGASQLSLQRFGGGEAALLAERLAGLLLLLLIQHDGLHRGCADFSLHKGAQQNVTLKQRHAARMQLCDHTSQS